MRRLAPLAILAVATVFAAAPAQADVNPSLFGKAAPARLHETACTGTPGSDACAVYQDRLLSDVATRTQASANPSAIKELGRRQLDALIASIQ